MFRTIFTWLLAAPLALALTPHGFGMAAAQAEPVSEFYRGKTVTITLTTAGGIYGLNAQLLSRYLPKHLPGHPNAIMVPKPGAGGLVNANFLANAAPPDGTVIGFVHKDIAVSQVIEAKQAKFDVNKFRWIGSVFPMNTVMFISQTIPVRSIEAARNTEIVMGATGRSHPTAIFPTFLNNMLGTRFKVVTGYRGAADVFLALDSGEVAGTTFAWDQVLTLRPKWASEKMVTPLVQVSTDKAPELPDIPLLVDVMRSDEDKRVAAFLVSGSRVGMAVTAPPNVPDDRVDALRRAFDAVTRDPDYLAEARKAKLDIQPLTGPKLEAFLAALMATRSPALDARLKKAIGAGDP